MRKKLLQSIKYVVILFIVIIGCNELNIVDIYNKVTQPYRGNEYENFIVPDTSIIFKVLDFNTGNPVKKVKVKLTKPDNDTLSRFTNAKGIAVFNFKKLAEGDYTAEAFMNKNGREYYVLKNYHLYKKNNSLLIIYIGENEPQ